MSPIVIIKNIMRKVYSLSSHHHLKIGLLILFVWFQLVSSLVWQRAGCHIVGHTQKISIPGCVEFEITTNACRGYCMSYSIPSSEDTLRVNSKQLITTIGQCCSMIDSEELTVRVMCIDGPRDLKFRSAKKCSCYHCKKY